MNRTIFALSVALTLFSSGVAKASGDGRNEASLACAKAVFDSNRIKCLSVVQKAIYFDQRAIGVCTQASFDSGLIDCLAAISDKDYLPGEIVSCSAINFDNQIIECMQSSGKPHSQSSQCGSNRELLNTLFEIRSNVLRGNIARAINDLDNLIACVQFQN